MDESERNSIVEAYFAAAEAMVNLEELASANSRNRVAPYRSTGLRGNGANDSLPKVSPARNTSRHPFQKSVIAPIDGQNSVLSQTSIRVSSTKTGGHAFGETCVEVRSGYYRIGARGLRGGADHPPTLICWEDMKKYQWMLDVLAELEAFATENSLAETAEALDAARVEIISLAAHPK